MVFDATRLQADLRHDRGEGPCQAAGEFALGISLERTAGRYTRLVQELQQGFGIASPA